jgi:ribosomal protein S12 methylthiotransferase
VAQGRQDRPGRLLPVRVGQGAPANDIDGAVPPEVKEERWHRFMQIQQAVSAGILKAKVGRTLPVIIDEQGSTVATGRTQYDAPEIDGVVYVASRTALKPARS